MKSAVLFLLAMVSSAAMAASDSVSSTSMSNASASEAISASSRSQALQTESIYYSLPRAEMTYLELGTYTQAQTFRAPNVENTHLANQAFFFNHSRGLTDELALDFGMDYFLRDNASNYGTTGINKASLGARSHFDAMNVSWIYGAAIGYLPENELLTNNKFVASGKIGFEERVDIAKWGMETELTTQDSAYFHDQLNLIGFFEIPFARQFNVGVAGGADLEHLSNSDQNNFARAYGQYAIEKVSAVQATLKQSNQKSGNQSLTQTEIGLSLNRVF